MKNDGLQFLPLELYVMIRSLLYTGYNLPRTIRQTNAPVESGSEFAKGSVVAVKNVLVIVVKLVELYVFVTIDTIPGGVDQPLCLTDHAHSIPVVHPFSKHTHHTASSGNLP